MEENTFSSLLEKAASDFPDNLAVSASGEFEIRLTRAQLRELVDHAAALLIASGVGAGDVVALAFPNTVEFVIMLLAVIRCRATALPLDPANSTFKFESYLFKSRAKLLLTPQEGNVRAHNAAYKLNIPDVTAKLHSANSKITLSSTDIEPDLDSLSKVVNKPLDGAFLLFRDLPVTQLNLASKVQFLKERYNLPESDSHVIVHPLYYADCLVKELLGPLAAGAAVAFPVATVATTTEQNETETERSGVEENQSCLHRWFCRNGKFKIVGESLQFIEPKHSGIDFMQPIEFSYDQSYDHLRLWSCRYGAYERSRPKFEMVGESGPEFSWIDCFRPVELSYDKFMVENDYFVDSRKLGEGGSGKVYEGHIAGTQVAVKMIKSDSAQGEKEFLSELMALSEFRHPNLVGLIGYCREANKFVLIYEFMRGGTLDDNLFNRNGPVLPWEMRHKIALGLALALHYLHEGRGVYVVHRDIKSGNIMLDENCKAKLGDFGLARLVEYAQVPKTTEKMGTQGYAALEYCETGKASKETDIYSSGVVLLEIGSGRRASDPARDSKDLVKWVWKQYGLGKLLDAVDSRLCKKFDKKQMKALMIVGLWCAHPIANSRPSIAEAMAVLNGEAKPPKLPLKMPGSLYDIDQKVSSGCFCF